MAAGKTPLPQRAAFSADSREQALAALDRLAAGEALPADAVPAPVRAWVNALPAWLEVLPVTVGDDPAFEPLDDGEKSALTLGMTLGADLILIDERKGAAVALQKGFQITGTLGLLTRSAQRGILDLADALARLKRTNFHYRQELFDDLLKKYAESGNG